MGTALLPFKTDIDCNIVNLIDEDYCIGDSLKIINGNIISLSSALAELAEYGDYWNDQYTAFSISSAKWFAIASDIQQYQSQWISASTTVATLSAKWAADFSVYYPKSIHYSSWAEASATQTGSAFPKWINLVFPATQYLSGQKIHLFVTFYDYLSSSKKLKFDYEEKCLADRSLFQEIFSVSYDTIQDKNGKSSVDLKSKKYTESTIDMGLTFQCPDIPPPSKYRGCNHHGGARDPLNGSGCTNAYSGCDFVEELQDFTATCSYRVNDENKSSHILSVDHEYKFLDKATVKVLKFVYTNNSIEWELSN